MSELLERLNYWSGYRIAVDVTADVQVSQVEDLPDEDQMKDFIGDIDFDDDFDVSEAQVSTMLLHLL